MDSVGDGAFHGIQECQYQFRNERWNCSTMVKGQPVFGKVINQGNVLSRFFVIAIRWVDLHLVN